MSLHSHIPTNLRRRPRRHLRRLSVSMVAVAAATALLATSPSGASRVTGAAHGAVLVGARVPLPKTEFPLGIPDVREPSGEAPPSAHALAGYTRTYTNDFNGKRLPSDWGTFAGIPQGDNQSRWLPSHVIMGGNVVRLIASRDPKLGNEWVTGGMCQCKTGHLYGAFFVRSRVTGPGPDQNEMLWPVAPVWPPEVDFNEMGYATNSTSWTVHYGSGSSFAQTTRSFDMERWHTWGVIWTPTTLTFTIDGKSWGVLRNVGEIPHQKMTLDIQQQVWCHPRLACPARSSALIVDWVAEYARG